MTEKAGCVISKCDFSVLSHGAPVTDSGAQGRGPRGEGGAAASSSSLLPPRLHLHPNSGLCQPGTHVLPSSHIWSWPGGRPRNMATQGDLCCSPANHHD